MRLACIFNERKKRKEKKSFVSSFFIIIIVFGFLTKKCLCVCFFERRRENKKKEIKKYHKDTNHLLVLGTKGKERNKEKKNIRKRDPILHFCKKIRL